MCVCVRASVSAPVRVCLYDCVCECVCSCVLHSIWDFLTNTVLELVSNAKHPALPTQRLTGHIAGLAGS